MTYLILILPVLMGYALVARINPGSKALQLLLSFSGAYLLSITVLHLLPEVFTGSGPEIGLYILIGIALQTGLEHLSKGAEHGHLHPHDFKKNIPVLLLFSLFLHALIEGMPLGLMEDRQLLWAIVVHKLPIAIILSVFLRNSDLPTVQTLLILVLFAFMSPLGAYLSGEMSWFNLYHTEVNALVVGVFLHISNAILFESTENHKFNLQRFLAIFVGFAVAMMT